MNIVSTLRKSRATVAVASVAALALTLSACGSDDSGSGGSGDKAAAAGITLVKPGKLMVCTHLPYKPFEYKDGTKIVGFDVDLLDLVAKDLGVEQEVTRPIEASVEGFYKTLDHLVARTAKPLKGRTSVDIPDIEIEAKPSPTQPAQPAAR